MSNPSNCVNCNIQNSNPTYASSNKTNIKNKIIQPVKRYNIGSLYDFETNNFQTSSIISKVIKVPSEIIGTSDSNNDQKKDDKNSKISQLNLSTLENVTSAIGPVDSNIITKDDENKNKKKDDQKKRIQQIEKDETSDVVLKLGRKIIKQSEKVKLSSTKQEEKIDKKKSKGYKTFGTVLASSVEFKSKFNSLLKSRVLKKEYKKKKDDLPVQFFGQEVWKDFIEPVREQGKCGGCYAFSSLFTLSSRLSIYTKGKYKYSFSPAKIIFCSITSSESTNLNKDLQNLENKYRDGIPYDYDLENKQNSDYFGCEGETLINMWQYLYRYGVPENSCFFYGDEENQQDLDPNLTLIDNSNLTCSNFLTNTFDVCPSTNKPLVSHRAGGYYFVPGTKNKNPNKESGSEYNIRKEIYKWGPCSSGMIIYEDFLSWDGNGIYKYDKKSKSLGGHAIVLIGWGEDNGQKYWVVRNSWGKNWGDNGYFKIIRGENECEIEENVFVGFPNIPGLRHYIDYPILFQVEDYIYKNLFYLHENGIKETTYEKLALGKLSESELNLKPFLYDIKYIPNFNNFVSANVNNNNIIENFFVKYYCNCKKCNKTNKIVICKVILIIIICIIILFLLS
jgi:cathepsin B